MELIGPGGEAEPGLPTPQAQEAPVGEAQACALGPDDGAGGPPRRSRWRVAFILLATVAVLAGIGSAATFGYIEHESATENSARASAWRDQATKAQDALLATRAQLDGARIQIDDTNSRVRGAQRSIRRLEKRQRQLVNEKDQLGDERLALDEERKRLEAESSSLIDIASSFIDCSNGLSDVVQALSVEDFAWTQANYPSISATCGVARSSLDTYNASH